jgi:hypothetical protein
VIRQDCQEELADVTAVVEAALEGLTSLQQQDFGAVRAVKQPTPSIRLTMEAICILRYGGQTCKALARKRPALLKRKALLRNAC